MNILDIDLDFFLDRASATVSTDSNGRLDSELYFPWNTEKVEKFLTEQCSLNKTKRIPGKLLTHHDEVFYEVRNFIESGKSTKVAIDHVDAHADLGLGDLCYKYIFFNLLRKPVKSRYYHDKDIPNVQKMGPGNFLLFMVACRWVSEIRYIHLEAEADDLNYLFFKNQCTKSRVIKLKAYCKNQIPKDFNQNHDMEFIKVTNPCRFEKDVPLITQHYKSYYSSIKYDFIFLTQSPTHTPIESDELIPIIMEYIKQD